MDKYQVKVDPNAEGEIPSEEDLLAAAEAAGWSDDPGTGEAIMLPGANGRPGYEVCNPIPFAPPIGWEPTPPIDQLIRERVKEEFGRLKDDDEIDDIVDAEDFDIPDELPDLSTIYEFMALEEEAPREKEPDKPITREERIKALLDEEELIDRERRLRKRRSREEYDRRVKEAEALYGPPDSVREALDRVEDKEGGR